MTNSLKILAAAAAMCCLSTIASADAMMAPQIQPDIPPAPDKGIIFFSEIDQQKLAADAGFQVRPSILIVFGNPPLGIQFLTANPYAGLDWPVRMLVTQDGSGQVWVAWTDFDRIAHRHHITDRDAQFKMAAEVAASIAS